MKNTIGISIRLMALVVVLVASVPARAAGNEPTTRISDSTVKVLIERELARRGIGQNAIAVGVEDHIATLSGAVSTLAEKARLTAIVQKVYSVSGVKADLEIRSISDSEIVPMVRKSIVLNSNYDAFDWIEARVLNGVVTLSGSVREPWRKDEFAARVGNVAGVQRIENEIRTLPLSTYDDEIRIRAARTVYGSGVLSRYPLGGVPPVHFIVEDGRLVLKGIVANKMDRQLVESLVRNNVLTLGVTNELQIEAAN